VTLATRCRRFFNRPSTPVGNTPLQPTRRSSPPQRCDFSNRPLTRDTYQPLPGFIFTSLFLPHFSAMPEVTLQRPAIILESFESLGNKGITRVIHRDQSDFHKPGVAGSSPAAAIVTTERLVLGQAAAVGCDSDRLVTWQICRSPRPNVACTTAGRRLLG